MLASLGTTRMLLGIATASLALASALPAAMGSESAPANRTHASSGSTKAPTSGSAAFKAKQDFQDSVRSVKERLLRDVAAEHTVAGAAFTDDNTIIVYGVGQPTGAQSRALAQAQADGLPASWHSVNYSEEQLSRAQESVLGVEGVTAVGLGPDFNSLDIKVDEAAPPSDAELGAALRAWPKLQYSVESQAAGIYNFEDLRSNDSSPFSGGGAIFTTIGNQNSYCTSGFRAYRSGTAKMLFAAHCDNGASGYDWNYTGSTSKSIGNSSDIVNTDYDVQALGGKSYTDRIWVGGATANQTQYTINGGAGTLALNEVVCLSGAFSGTQCGTVTDPNFSASGVTLHTIEVSGGGAALAGTGDSGAPAYQTSGTALVHVAGLISFADNSAGHIKPCSGITSVNGVARVCSDLQYVTSWARFKDQFSTPLTLSP